ncbi:MAG: SAM-dependent methyltransferase, partial [Myxococcota bacterium]
QAGGAGMTAELESFDPGGLGRREPYDHRARSVAVADRFVAALPAGAVDLVDLGCGLGSNLRWLAPRIDRPQRWVLLDHDVELLGRLEETLRAWARSTGRGVTPAGDGLRVGRRRIDLRAPEPWPEADGIVTQALLDLVDERWLGSLVQRLAGRPLLAALTVDGRVGWSPPRADDAEVNRAFRAHQTRGKPGVWAAPWLAGRLAAAGYEVALAEADWRVAHDPSTLGDLVAGFAGAAGEILGDPAVAGWRSAREADRAAGTLEVTVGHLDLVAVDPRRAG